MEAKVHEPPSRASVQNAKPALSGARPNSDTYSCEIFVALDVAIEKLLGLNKYVEKKLTTDLFFSNGGNSTQGYEHLCDVNHIL
jgi:hypothetical protein